MCTLDPTRSKLVLTLVRFDAGVPGSSPYLIRRRGVGGREVTLHISQRSLITSFVPGPEYTPVWRERGPIVVFD